MNKDTIIAYVRTGHKKMKGVVIATKNPADENEILITGSVCHRNDEFDLQKGIGIAQTRAKSMSAGRDVKVPQSLKHPMEYLNGKAQKYFKQATNFVHSAIAPTLAINDTGIIQGSLTTRTIRGLGTMDVYNH